ncbi:MAG: GldG family protein [Gammaproteobacteria bacterium]|nr:GldG family protein [Gammaproteobacteria bacterium]
MRITGKTRRELFIQNLVYYVLLIAIAGLLAWLSVRHSTQIDWSANNRNTLNQVSRDIAQKIDGPVHVTAFVLDDEMTRSAIRNLIGRYQRYKKDIELEFVNPQTSPGRSREMNINSAGELIVQYGDAQQHLQQLTEETFTNALQKLARKSERWIVFLTGHGERDPYAGNDLGLSKFTERAGQQGFTVQSLNLFAEQNIPDNTSVLVIASPQKNYLAGEIEIILNYVRNGGNLLWLTEPENPANLDAIEKELGVERLPGVVVDATGQMFGITQPDFVLVVNYPDGKIMRDFNEFTLFPQAVGLVAGPANPLELTAVTFLQTLARSWTESGPIEGNIEFNENANEIAGPIDIGIGLSRTLQNADSLQRIAVIGDGDFLTNAYIGYGSNMLLAVNIMNWLSHDDDLISVDAVSAPDTQLTISNTYLITVALLFLVILPLLLVTAGIVIWLKRRKK